MLTEAPEDDFKSSVAWLLEHETDDTAAQSVLEIVTGVREKNMAVFGPEFMQKLESGLSLCSKHSEL